MLTDVCLIYGVTPACSFWKMMNQKETCPVMMFGAKQKTMFLLKPGLLK